MHKKNGALELPLETPEFHRRTGVFVLRLQVCQNIQKDWSRFFRDRNSVQKTDEHPDFSQNSPLKNE